MKFNVVVMQEDSSLYFCPGNYFFTRNGHFSDNFVLPETFTKKYKLGPGKKGHVPFNDFFKFNYYKTIY